MRELLTIGFGRGLIGSYLLLFELTRVVPEFSVSTDWCFVWFWLGSCDFVRLLFTFFV